MKKHAYLIMAHNEFILLEKLLSELDDERSDIYLHIDKKIKNVPFERLRSSVTRSNLIFIPRSNVAWGGFSLSKCEYRLLKAAVKGHYQYYHLISGVDFPLKTQNEINDYFDVHCGKEYIDFDLKTMSAGNHLSRIRRYFFFQDRYGNRGDHPFFRRLEKLSRLIQNKLNIDRTRNLPIQICKGTNWVSLTHEFSSYVVSVFHKYKKYFRWTYISDELWLQTIINNSPYADRRVDDSLRLIDWHRGRPYTFTEDDFTLLTASDKIFARKLSYEKYPGLIDKLEDYLKSKG